MGPRNYLKHFSSSPRSHDGKSKKATVAQFITKGYLGVIKLLWKQKNVKLIITSFSFNDDLRDTVVI